MLLSNVHIRTLCQTRAMIEPWVEGVKHGVVASYGLSHAGYDLRLGDTMLVFKNSFCEVIDPARFPTKEDAQNQERRAYFDRLFDRVVPEKGGFYLIPGHSYVLGFSHERLSIPRNIKGRCVGKSTYARAGLVVNTTPAEPGWQGHLTIEIANSSPCPVKVYAMQGICQMEFEVLSCEPDGDYAEAGGRYQNQGPEPTAPRGG